MSAQQLQRVVVRMLYDPDFVTRIFVDPTAALQDEDLTDTERSWLVQVDRRAYAVDPFRQARTLTALIEEFPVSVHALGHQAEYPALIEAFFRSSVFHACIQQRGSLAAAWSIYLGSDDIQRSILGSVHPSLVHMESAIARLRRQSYGTATTAAAHDDALLALASTTALLYVPAGTLAYYHTVLDILQRHPEGLVAAACQPSTVALPMATTVHEWLLIVWHCASASATIELLPDALGQVLATVPASQVALRTRLETLGANCEEAQEILDDLLADGVLCAHQPVAGSAHD
jgi:hypothetical protein